MSDIYGDEMRIWAYVEATMRSYFSARLYEEIRTPIVEYTELFTRSIGESSDIVSKEMYTFVDRGERSLTMRPEGTASVIRAIIENSLVAKRDPLKLFYMGPMFRAERPQKGRKRQFYQCGVEMVGDLTAINDAEVIRDAVQFVDEVGIPKDTLSVKINTLGCSECRTAFIETLKKYFKNDFDALCEDCHFRYDKNVLRIFDCKNKDCRGIIDKAPKVTDNVCPQCERDFAVVQEELTRFQVPFVVDKDIVRGLDYYTGVVFELTSSALGAQDALGAGGRYDNLMAECGGPKKSAVGFAFGMERMMMCLGNVIIPDMSLAKTVYVAYGDNEYASDARDIAAQCETNGIATYGDYEGRSLKSQMKRANKFGFRWMIILNVDEWKEGTVTIKDLAAEDDGQVIVAQETVAEKIEELMGN